MVDSNNGGRSSDSPRRRLQVVELPPSHPIYSIGYMVGYAPSLPARTKQPEQPSAASAEGESPPPDSRPPRVLPLTRTREKEPGS